ncbi:SusC/RagA family TonB-linked outer membrane protein [Gelidibacter mesophilus]|uniref:SusC/RagA family TonB-linked outer membrane protein n=1 Tax=Gelidibacter mesophilus TaxID=169050 RepID=UPI000484A947|nr:TonB-dependent receptor [Gelidibacter mesophilus]
MKLQLRKRTTSNIKGLRNLIMLTVVLSSVNFALGNLNVTETVFDSSTKIGQQLLKVQGRVYDSNEPPMAIAFVTVAVKNTNKGVITDDNGYFTIEVERGDILRFSSVGYSSQEFKVEKAYPDLIISLKEDIAKLDELVITGYGEERKMNMISSISTLDVAKNVANKPITSMSQALQGGVTGLTVTQSTGLPGGDAASIKIRGISTLGHSDPLVLVDGIPMDMNDLDPNTIESVTVLKDASAAAIYGARAANGVIIIKTQRGKTGQVSVSYNAYVGIQNATYLPDFMDGGDYMEMVNTAYINNGGNGIYNQETIDITRNKSDIFNYPNTNWLDETWIKNPLMTSHSVGVQGGNNIARFALTVNYLDQEGFIENVGFERVNIRANTTITLTDNVTVNMDFNAIRKDQMETNIRDGETDYVLNYIYRAPPNLVPKYPSKDGIDFYGIFFEMRNPKAMLERGGFTQRLDDNMSINLQPKWEILPNLNLNGQYSYRINSDAMKQSRDAYNFFEYETGVLNYTWDNVRSSSTGRSSYYFLGANVDYTYVNDKHRLFLLGGYNQELTNAGNWDQWAMRSYFGKANYTYNNKYLAEVTFRADGSSRFGQDNKNGYFPSFGLGWNMHEESFLNEYSWLDNLKLRVSYGQLGNENIGLYQYQNLVSAGNGVETVFGNPNITWETVNMLNYGFDLAIFDDFTLNFDVYDKLTKDIILSPPTSLIGGTTSAKINAGEVRNRGFELSVNYSRNFEDAYFAVHGGISRNKNVVEKLPGGPYINGSSIHKVGYALGSNYRFLTDGLLQESDFTTNATGELIPKEGVTLWGDQKPGDIKFIDVNGDGNFDNNDRVITGDGQPDFNYFTNFSAGYKNWDFELLLQGVQGVNAAYSGAHAIPLNLNGDSGSTPQKFHSDYWTPSNPNAYYPRPTPEPGNNLQPSDYWNFDASYLRVKYIQLGYTFKEGLLSPVGIKSGRIYVNAQNPFTFTSQKVTDPENLGGSSTYPLIKVLTLGINAKF